MINMAEVMYRILIMRHKLKLLWFEIHEAEGSNK